MGEAQGSVRMVEAETTNGGTLGKKAGNDPNAAI